MNKFFKTVITASYLSHKIHQQTLSSFISQLINKHALTASYVLLIVTVNMLVLATI